MPSWSSSLRPEPSPRPGSAPRTPGRPLRPAGFIEAGGRRLNAASSGDFIEKGTAVTITGTEGEEYTLPDNEYEDLDLVELPQGFRSTFRKGEINVLFRYTSHPDPFKDALKYVAVALGVIAVMCIGSVFVSRYQRKKRMMQNLDIIENADKKQ